MQTSSEGRLVRIFQESQTREKEALKCYRPMNAAQLRVHESNAKELIARGGKRSGKSTSIACEFVSRILGECITREDGTRIPLKYPAPTKDDKRIYWVIGYDVNHIGQTLYRLLFEPGLFRVTKENGKWRAWHPERDAHLPSEPCGPAVPPRMIEEIDWESRSAKHFREVRLVNGAMIRAYPSTARTPKQGDPVSGLWIDEDIQSPEHLKEYQDRLTDRDGWFLWSAWPHVENDALMGLLDRAEDTVNEEKPLIEAVKLVMSDNAFITDTSKEHAFARMGDEEEVLRRNEGELLLGSIAMYDFVKGLHTINKPKGPVKFDPTEWRDYLTQLYLDYGNFPASWTRYMAIDPSHTRTGVCFGVVPPPEVDGIHFGNMVIVEREIVLKKANATVLAEACAKVMRGLRYEAFVMDKAMGRKTNVGTDLTIFEVYAQAFKAAGLFSAQTKNWFVPGINITEQRYRAVRNALEVNNEGKVGVLLVGERTPQTQQEFKSYRKRVRRAADGLPLILDEPANPKAHDCMAALEYLIAFLELEFARGAGYVTPREQVSTGGSAAYRASQLNLFGRKPEESSEYVHLGAGARAGG